MTEKEELEKMLDKKFPNACGVAIIRYEEDGEIKHRFILVPNNDLRHTLRCVAPKARYIESAIK